ncbi:hypothetical protein vseg_006650 [Gypsophila vaccaria]
MSCVTNEKPESLKLMIDKKAKKVAFAEAGQEFVDLISQMMSFSLSTFMSLLYVKGMGGCGLNFKSGNSATSEPKPRTPSVERVKDGVVYMVTDNLEVKPMSLALVSPYVKVSSRLEEKVVQVGSREVQTSTKLCSLGIFWILMLTFFMSILLALAMLKTSFQTNAVLTTVFLGKNIDGSKPKKSSVYWKVFYVVLILSFIRFLAE